MKSIAQTLTELAIPFELAPAQLSELERLSTADRIALLWEVGCGKTVGSTIWAFSRDRAHNLVIIPPILLRQWRKWLLAVLPAGMTVEVYYGPKRSESQLDANWIVTSHSVFRRDFTKIMRKLLPKDYTVVLDEAQNAKSISSKLYKYTKTLSAGQPLALLTATPTSNPADAYAYIELKTPEAYRSFAHFEALHVVDKDIFGRVTGWQDIETIADHLMVNASKLTKEEAFAGAIKKPIYIPMEYELAPAHQKLYEKLVDECLLEYVESGLKIDASTPQRLYHLTQQMVMNYGYFSNNPQDKSSGLDLLDEVIEETGCLDPSRSKLMVWLWYQQSFKTVMGHITKKYGDIAVAAYGGSNAQRATQIFEEDPSNRIIVAQPKSVGVGFNAHTVSSEALMLEYSTVSMDTRQSCGRIDRIGQTRIPNIRIACAANTVQAKVYENLFRNDDLVSRVELNSKTLRELLMGR